MNLQLIKYENCTSLLFKVSTKLKLELSEKKINYRSQTIESFDYLNLESIRISIDETLNNLEF